MQNGDPVGYQYNAQGLVTQETFADGTSQTFTYDAHGNLLTAQDLRRRRHPHRHHDADLQRRQRADLDHLSQRPVPRHSPTTPQGQRTKSVDQDGFTVNYTYDALGRLSKLTDGSGNLIVQYTYNNLGQLAEKLNGNGTYTTYAYDAAGNLTSEVNYAPDGTTVNSSFTYTYNVLGEQTSHDRRRRQHHHLWLRRHRPVDAGDAARRRDHHLRLQRGRRPHRGHQQRHADQLSSNADNEITQVGSAIVHLRRQRQPAHRDRCQRHDHVHLQRPEPTGVDHRARTAPSTTFQYSPLGFLVGDQRQRHARRITWSIPTGLGNVVASYNGSGSLIADYAYGLGLVSQTGPSGTGYYDFDASGNTVGITGSSGYLCQPVQLLPFGETTTISAALPNPFTFAGQAGVMQIGANLFSMRARVYSPSTGQFLSNDPLRVSGGGLSNRRYVAINDPLGWYRPFGLETDRQTY